MSPIDGGIKRTDAPIAHVDVADLDPVEKVFIAAADPEWQIMEEYATALGVEPRKPFEFDAGNGWYFNRQDIENARGLVASAVETTHDSCQYGPTTRVPDLPTFPGSPAKTGGGGIMSAQAIAWAWKQRASSSGAKLLLIYFALHADDRWTCAVLTRSLIQECAASPEQASLWLDELRTLNLVSTTERETDGQIWTTVQLAARWVLLG